jgi:hypothetical protein
VSYTPHDKHRDQTPNASQWTVTRGEEAASFAQASTQQWGTHEVLWGLHLVANAPAVLGYDVLAGSGRVEVMIAKFVENQGDWHGYPVAHWIGTNDKPNIDTLDDWLAQNLINATVRSKIYRGKRCKL